MHATTYDDTVLDATQDDFQTALAEIAAAREARDWPRMAKATALLQSVNARWAGALTTRADG